MHQVINNDYIFELFVGNNSQVFDEESIMGLHAVLSVKYAKNCFFLLIEVVNNRFSIVLDACCENVDVVDLAHSVKELETVGPHVELKLIALVSEPNVGLLVGEDRVNQRLVEI